MTSSNRNYPEFIELESVGVLAFSRINRNGYAMYYRPGGIYYIAVSQYMVCVSGIPGVIGRKASESDFESFLKSNDGYALDRRYYMLPFDRKLFDMIASLAEKNGMKMTDTTPAIISAGIEMTESE